MLLIVRLSVFTLSRVAMTTHSTFVRLSVFTPSRVAMTTYSTFVFVQYKPNHAQPPRSAPTISHNRRRRNPYHIYFQYYTTFMTIPMKQE